MLPSLNTCTTTPAKEGCKAVLPSISTCTAAPATAGCAVVLPSLPSCVETPSQEGCNTVLPTVSKCTTNPELAGCEVVLSSTQTGSKPVIDDPIKRAVNVTTNEVVEATINPETTLPTSGQGADGSTKTAPISESKSSESKKSDDSKKDEKKVTAGPQDDGVKKNDTAKKMYCN